MPVSIEGPPPSPVTAPFTYFGGKQKVAELIWERLGNVARYIEPFFGSGANLLLRPHEPGFEIANDMDGFVVNFFRATAHDKEAVVKYCNQYVHEVDLHARHRWIHRQADFIQRMKDDPDYFDPKVAGIWVWGMSSWIGNAWSIACPCNTIPNITTFNGVHKLDIRGASNFQPEGGEEQRMLAYFGHLEQRLRHVKFCCGGWERVVTPAALGNVDEKKNETSKVGIFLDPPYPSKDRVDVYANEDYEVANRVRTWCIENGDNPNLRIILAGYEGEHEMPKGWDVVYWSATGGYSNQSKTKENLNRKRERLWVSPHCLQTGLFS